MFYLRIKALDGGERRVPLSPGAMTIGRAPDNTLVLDRFGVSARHAEVRVGEHIVLRDLGSTNGTFVNGYRVTDAKLSTGDRLLIGSVLLVLQDAISDRILLRHAAVPQTAPRRAPVAGWFAGGATGAASRRSGARRRPARRPATARETGATEPASVRELLDRLLRGGRDDAGGRSRLSAGLHDVATHLGAHAAWLVGATGGGAHYPIAAAVRAGDPAGVELRHALIRRAIDTGRTAVDDAVAAAGARHKHLCVPLREGDERPAALYLVTSVDRLASTRRSLAALEPVLSALALIAGREEARAALEWTNRALAEGAEWPVTSSTGEIVRDDLLGHSRKIRDVLHDLEHLAGVDDPLLIHGERGTGKRQAAARIHALSGRRRGPFLAVNCSIGSRLLESELLGFPGGTGALAGAGRPGKLALAHGGTLFLDSVVDLAPPLQQSLLDVAEHRALPGAGGHEGSVDVRLVFGAPVSMEALTRRGTLLPALLERLRARQIRMPPLRDRREDIIPLAQHFVRRFAARLHRRILGLSSEACAALNRYRWHGNLLELEQVVQRAVLLAEDEIIDVDRLPPELSQRVSAPAAPAGLAQAMDLPWREAKLAFERTYLQWLLDSTGGNVARSSRRAGIARKNFYYKLRQHGLLPHDH